jgi:predicted dehydrogenase
VYEEVGALLETERPDILHVATPTETHADLLVQAAAQRVPVVICEKPLSSSAAEARDALDCCHAAGTIVLVNYERRYSRNYLHARALIRGKSCGALLSVQARLYMGRGHRPAEILLEDGTHLVDVIRFLTDREIEPRHTEGDPFEAAETLQLLFRCGEAAGFLEVSGRHEALVFELEMGFERGRLRIGNGIYERWDSAPSRFYERFFSLQPAYHRRFRRTGYFAGMLADAVAVAREPGRRPVSSGEDGLRALEVIEAMLSGQRDANGFAGPKRV